MEVTFGLGVLLSLAAHELLNVSPGGIIVPGYLALYLTQPARLGGTFLVSLATLGVVKLLSNAIILYGRRKFACYVVVGLILTWVLAALHLNLAGPWRALGYVIPGLIARDMERQGVLATVAAALLVACLVYTFSLALRG
ncbi:poly-gamma-glutamate biosynthesis protein PgsC [Gelria sp. Kuro-4]|uniref:poly-gamma-glutamate biosynthesis protein PgsC n=1 Tax=Gelria sp. Kuro-4 TaxID=2796927 RepID=UPI001BEFBE09|nr:poly-gamma-glutamate biosynthesis protein PgsC [Gelria sp. Kuro-4]BCV23928.1 poly-gamma-glutamate biosynthesis protein PgsC [Gelria sp. Kuro-4]